jgi:signal transduction histidine kinase/ligand-binding sensor domain-containing protein
MDSRAPTRLRWALFASLLWLVSAQPALADREFRKLGVGRGLDANVVTSMLVDRNGLLWVASREGLYSYDGYLATSYRSSPDQPGSLSDVDIRSLYEARDGALWVSTNTGGLNRRDPLTGQFTQFHHDSANPRSLSSESVYSVAQDAHGNVWVATQNGLNRLEPDGRNFTRFFHERGKGASLAANWVYPLHLGPSGRLWVGTVGGGVDRWDQSSGGFEHFSLSKLLAGAPEFDFIYALHEAADGRLWVGTRMGLVVLERDGASATKIDLATVPDGEVPLVTAIYPDRRGQLWIATIEHGVLVVDPATGRSMRPHAGTLGEAGSLPDSEYLSITGTDNTVFIGSWGSGVYSAPLEEPQFWLLVPQAQGTGLQTGNVTSVMGGDTAGRPWVGSFGGGVMRVHVLTHSSSPAARALDDPLSAAGILSMAPGHDGSYFGGSTDGLYRFAADGSNLGHDRYSADSKDGIGEGYVVSLLPDGDSLWVGTGGSGLFRRSLREPKYVGYRHDPAVATSLSGDFITALAPGRAGRLWVGTRSDGLNLCVIEPFSCERFDGRTAGARNITNYHVTSLHRDGGGTLWVATDGGGVHRVNEDAQGRVVSIERWDDARGLLDNGIMAVESDDDGSLWLSTRHGVSRLDPKTGRVVNYVRESGLPVMHFNTGASSSDFRWIYFGSVDGLLSIPRGSAMPSRAASPLHVTRIRSLTEGAEQPLPLDKQSGGFETRFGDGLAIEFAVLDYAETPHDYAYRLKDGDEWTALGKRRQLTFFGLAAGQYRFEVRGRDAYGNWSTSPPVTFEVVPPFWRTTWFKVLAIGAVVLLALGLHLTRLRSLRRRNAVLEQLQRQRELALAQAERSQHELEEAYAGLRQLTGRLESAKEEERSHLSRELHDEFGQTLTAAKINLQMLRQAAPDSAHAQKLEDSVRMIDGMIHQARNIALGLRPPLLDEAGLVPALGHHLEALAGRAGVRIDFDPSGGASVPPELNVTVFRLVQEAVNNALRHANATAIRVSLSETENELSLVVEDDGVGFDPGAVAERTRRGEHLGLLGMTERARSAGGRIELDSRPGGGSRIEVRLPLAAAGAAP